MPIKKSSLEKKWYYRLAKTFFIILGVIIALLLLLQKRIYICSLPQKLDVNFLIFILVGLILYFLFIILIWRIFLYVAFGGLEDDMKKDEQKKPVISDEKLLSDNQKLKQMAAIPLIILIIVMIIIFLALKGYINLPKINFDFENSNKMFNSGYTCPATSAQTDTPCHSAKGGVAVLGIIVPETCPCPSDTKFSQMDNITAGGPYRICVCK